MKEEILQKSLELFLKYGIREMSNQRLVESLGISTKTVYKYFTNKEELLEEILHLYHGKQYEMLKNLPLEQNVACLFFDVWQIAVETEYKVNKVFYQDLHYYYPELEKKVNAVIGKRFEEHFLSILHRGIKQGDFRKDIIPEVVLQSVFVLLKASLQTDKFKQFALSATDLLLNTIGNYIRGLCSEKGLQALEAHIGAFKSSKEAVMV
jgi:AcrR family transcriptional regulator